MSLRRRVMGTYGGVPCEDTLEASLLGTLDTYSNDTVTSIEQFAFYYNHSSPKHARFPNATSISRSAFQYSQTLETFFAPKAVINGVSAFGAANLLRTAVLGCPNNNAEMFRKYTVMVLETVEFAITEKTGKNYFKFGNRTFQGCDKLNTLILRAPYVYTVDDILAFDASSMDSGGSGCTIYIPKVLYDELGTGSALDYKAATNWSTIDGYGTITWAQIEGSQYEHYYADGTPIPEE